MSKLTGVVRCASTVGSPAARGVAAPPTFPVASALAVADLCSFVQDARGGLLVLSGAGLSTASGIPDYRSTSLVRKHKPIQHDEFVSSAAVRQRYWARSFVGFPRLSRSQPNHAHHALAWLQAQGIAPAHVTQNVDGLLQAAGCGGVVELHGTIHHVHCLHCGLQVPRTDHQSVLEKANEPGLVQQLVGVTTGLHARPDGDYDLSPDLIRQFRVPACRQCRSDLLSPSVVFFGGRVPAHVGEQAAGMVDSASALLVVGSTCATWSAFRLVRAAKEQGKKVALLTVGETRADSVADLKVEADIPHTMRHVQTILQSYSTGRGTST